MRIKEKTPRSWIGIKIMGIICVVIKQREVTTPNPSMKKKTSSRNLRRGVSGFPSATNDLFLPLDAVVELVASEGSSGVHDDGR